VDYPKRHNYMHLQGIEEEPALKAIEEQSVSLERMLAPMMANTGIVTKRFRELWDVDSECNLNMMTHEYASGGDFTHDVNTVMAQFMGPHALQGPEYLLEELALLTRLSHYREPIVEIYPGITQVEQKLHQWKYPMGIFTGYHTMRHVDAHDDHYTKPFSVKKARGMGRAVFTKRPFDKDEFIMRAKGPIKTECNDFTFPITDGLYIDPKNIARFICHSCKPNAGMKNRDEIWAMRDIKPGEQIAIDYAMLIHDHDYGIDCACNTKECRGTLGAWKTLPNHLKLKYRGWSNPTAHHPSRSLPTSRRTP